LEQATGRRLLSYIHGTFSGAAAFGALTAGLLLSFGTQFRSIYVGLALMLLIAATIFSESAGFATPPSESGKRWHVKRTPAGPKAH
jgi:hypothetical protein